MQNNCSYLNEYIREDDRPNSIDFCTITEFNPAILGQAMKAVNFLGLSGPISFDRVAPTRKTANMIVKQFYSNRTAVVIGLYIEGVLTLNISRLTFKKIPVSGMYIKHHCDSKLLLF